MIGEPTLDPRLGDKRRKALQAALARAAGLGGSQSPPPFGAVGRGAVSGFGFHPLSHGGRPAGILNFLSRRGPNDFARGLAAYRSASGGLGRTISDVQMPTPIPPSAGGGGSVGTPGGSIPTTGGVGGAQQTADALNAEDPNKQIPAQVTPSGSVFEGSLPSYTDVMSPSSGWIPLGGGMFLDPDTGVLHGAGQVSGGIQQ